MRLPYTQHANLHIFCTEAIYEEQRQKYIKKRWNKKVLVVYAMTFEVLCKCVIGACFFSASISLRRIAKMRYDDYIHDSRNSSYWKTNTLSRAQQSEQQ